MNLRSDLPRFHYREPVERAPLFFVIASPRSDFPGIRHREPAKRSPSFRYREAVRRALLFLSSRACEAISLFIHLERSMAIPEVSFVSIGIAGDCFSRLRSLAMTNPFAAIACAPLQ